VKTARQVFSFLSNEREQRNEIMNCLSWQQSVVNVALACAALISITHAAAGETRRIATVPTVGSLTHVVNYQPSVGSHLDRNEHRTVGLAGSDFDTVIVKSADDTFKRMARNDALGVALNLATIATDSAFTEGKFSPSEPLLERLKNEKATHVVVVSPYRAETRIKFGSGSIGSGHISGIGIYLDSVARSRSREVGSAPGILAPYVYLKFSLINLTDGKIEAEHTVKKSLFFSAARDIEGSKPWNALSDTAKVVQLHRLIRSSVTEGVTALFADEPQLLNTQ
jgi:hypothetical protein